MRLHLLAHNDKNFVKVGDVVEQYKTKIASIGTGNNSYLAHLHHSVSEGLSVPELRAYNNGWTTEKTTKYYSRPTCDYTKMFGRVMDVGKAGYDWLAWNRKGYHPGLDINGTGGGNTDIGYEYTSPCDGKVIYVSNTNAKDGWGKIVIIEEINIKKEEEMSNAKNVKEVLKAISALSGKDYGSSPNDNETKDIKKFLEGIPQREDEMDEALGECLLHSGEKDERIKELVSILTSSTSSLEGIKKELERMTDGKSYAWNGENFVEKEPETVEVVKEVVKEVEKPGELQKVDLAFCLKTIFEIIWERIKNLKKL